MLHLFKRRTESTDTQSAEKPSWLTRLKQGLKKTRTQFSEGLGHLIFGKKTIDQNLLDEIETFLLTADVGLPTTELIIARLTEQVARKQLTDARALWEQLQKQLYELLYVCEQPLKLDAQAKPYVILVLGVNGVGKTTSIGKLAWYFSKDHKRVLLAAGDTFRAAAIEQLQIWSQRTQVPLIAQHQGADSASVIYDALQAARARGMDVLIADTAGRLHTKDNLMHELQKIKRVLARIDAQAPHEILLVLDASMGQNTLMQAEQFHQALQVTGIALTKLDGTAKGGIIFEVARRLRIPIRFIGVGEDLDDLRPFTAREFIDALFGNDLAGI